MSAIQIAKNTLCSQMPVPKEFLELMVKKFPDLPSVEELMKDEEIVNFVSTKKRKTSTPEERRGSYDPGRCDARIWKAKKGAGACVGYDDIQCSSKKIGGGCLCKKHAAQQAEGNLWLGLITEPRPAKPIGPPGSKNPREHRWSTDEDGNDIVFEKKERKKKEKKEKKEKKKSTEEYSLADLKLLLQMKEKEKEEEKEEESDYDKIVFEGKEYMMSKEDKVVLNMDNSKIIGKWDTEKEAIIFNEQ